MVAVEAASGKVLSTDKKGEKFTHPAGKQTFYSAMPVALDVNQDGKITRQTGSGWRNFLRLCRMCSACSPICSTKQPKNYYDNP